MNEPSTNANEVTTLPVLPPRPADAHKGMFGRVLIIAGSRGMGGAAALAGMAALRGGAGLVTVACPEVIADLVASFEPSYLTLPLPSDERGLFGEEAILRLKEQKTDVIALGPGLGTSMVVTKLVAHLLNSEPVPLILDADAINCLSGSKDILKHRKHPTVLTPHVGEFARLTGLKTEQVQLARVDNALWFAREFGVVAVLKGHATVVAEAQRYSVNRTGNPGMATGGTGDVLTGLMAALIGQGLTAFDGARLAVHLHGAAGDLAAAMVGQISLTARDLIDFLPAAFRQHQPESPRSP
jgi:NAD(P)H-hydrate epimerase